MPGSARIVAVGFPHHITQRGDGRRPVFFSDRDCEVYLRQLAGYAEQVRFRIWGFCLMPNHTHIIGVPGHEESLWRMLGRTHGDYARYQNIQQTSCGHFWQARFYSCPMDHVHQREALAERLKEATRRGLPWGREEPRHRLEPETGRDLRPRRAGRPRKAPETTEGRTVASGI